MPRLATIIETGFQQRLRAFYNYLEVGGFTRPAPFPTFEDGRREVVLGEAILKSHREPRWVRAEESGS